MGQDERASTGSARTESLYLSHRSANQQHVRQTGIELRHIAVAFKCRRDDRQRLGPDFGQVALVLLADRESEVRPSESLARRGLTELLRTTAADELMLVCDIHDPALRLRSLDIVAKHVPPGAYVCQRTDANEIEAYICCSTVQVRGSKWSIQRQQACPCHTVEILYRADIPYMLRCLPLHFCSGAASV
jgi:hypothetical protein